MPSIIDVTNIELKNDTLTLKAWSTDYLYDFYEFSSIQGVGQMAGWLPHESIQESLAILKYFIKNKNVFMIIKDNKAIGSLEVSKPDEIEIIDYRHLKTCELGFALSKDYWGKGIMPEAASLVIDYLFNEEDFDAIFCAHYEHNNQSARVQEKLGFKFYRMTTSITNYATVENTILNTLTKDAWLSKNRQKVLF